MFDSIGFLNIMFDGLKKSFAYKRFFWDVTDIDVEATLGERKSDVNFGVFIPSWVF